MNIIKNPKLVIALDIGSTYSGYAWQYRDEFEGEREPHFNTNWSAGALQLHKTKTCLMIKCTGENSGKPMDESTPLFNPDEMEEVRIGYDAENTYMKIAKKKDHELLGKYYLFKHFKMRLYIKVFDLFDFYGAILAEVSRPTHLPWRGLDL
ncbi:hypothetical protein ACF0H5_017719 [Mactra antiquata]